LAFSYYENGISSSLSPKFIHHESTNKLKESEEGEESAKEWINDKIKKKDIKSIKWTELNSVEEIGKENFGSVYKAF